MVYSLMLEIEKINKRLDILEGLFSDSSLTKKQKKVFDFIDNYSFHNGYAPTYRQIATHFKVSVATVQDYLNQLVKKKKIMKIPGGRGIKILQDIKPI